MVHSSSHLKWIMEVAIPAIYWIDVIEVSVKRYPLNLVCNNMSKATADSIPNTISRLQRQPAVLQNMKTVARWRGILHLARSLGCIISVAGGILHRLQGSWGILYQLQEVYYYTSCYKEQRYTIPVAKSLGYIMVFGNESVPPLISILPSSPLL